LNHDINKTIDTEFLTKEEKYKIERKTEVLQLILAKDYDRVSEEIVNYLEIFNHFYSIRDDDKEEIWVYRNGIYIPNGKSHIKEVTRHLLDKAYSIYIVNQVIAKIITDNYIDHEEFFNNYNKDEICILNGILNVKTRELETFTHEKIFFTKLNTKYVKEADCKKIKSFFLNTLNVDDVKGMQELIGYCLYRDNFLEKAFLFRGNGSNGKSKTLELIALFLGAENISSITYKVLEKHDSFEIVNLHGKFANLTGELSKSAIINTDRFKELTGRDSINASRKFKTSIQFTNHAKLIFNCNDRPPTYDISDGFFRRWNVFNFNKTFVDKDYYNKIKEEDKCNYGIKILNIIEQLNKPIELSGLLNWALNGLDSLFNNKLFSNEKTTEDTRNEWLRDSNSFIVFFDDNLELARSHKCIKSDIRTIYSEFCEDKGLDVVSDKDILKFLQTKGILSKRVNVSDSKLQEYCWLNMKFKHGRVNEDKLSLYVENDNLNINNYMR